MMKRLTRMILRGVLFLVAVLWGMIAVAIPARRMTFTHRQSNGTVLRLMLVGDEFAHYYVDMATGRKMSKEVDGDYHLLTDSLLKVRMTVGNERRAAANLVRRERLVKNFGSLTNVQMAGGILHSQRQADSTGVSVTGGVLRAQSKVASMGGDIKGSKKGLVILVNFTDKKMATSHTQEVFERQFNEVGYSDEGHLGSVHDYFYDQSYGMFDLTFDVIGPVTVSQPMSYYGASTSEGNDSYPAEMVIEACQLIKDEVNFADYDWDGDGEVDQVYVIYAGYGESYGADTNTIWPHEWTLSSASYYGDGSGSLTLDGVKIDTYACSCELAWTQGNTLNGIGTACHEFSHCLGFPDFYDTTYSGGFGMNVWDLMDSGSFNGPTGCGEVPAGFTSYERWCAGWLTPTPLSSDTIVMDMKALDKLPEAYIIYNDKNTNEYLLLENRQNHKWFRYVDTYTTPHGLLVMHVDYNATAWDDNEPNNTVSHQRMTIIPASGNYGEKVTNSDGENYLCSEEDLRGHVFGGSGSVTSLTADSHSAVGGKWFTTCSTGTTALNHTLTDVVNAADSTLSFSFDGGTLVDDGTRHTLCLCPCASTDGTTSIQQTSFRETIQLPAMTAPDGTTFAGWSRSEITNQLLTQPNLYAAGERYLPVADDTLYAVFSCHAASTNVVGFKLHQTYSKDGKTYYVSTANSNKFNCSTEGGITLYYHEGYLWYCDNGEPMYVYNKPTSSSQYYLGFTTNRSSATPTWTMDVKNDSIVNFSTNDRLLAIYAFSGNKYVRVYSSANNSANNWVIRYNEERFPVASSTTIYSSYPTVNIQTVSRYIGRMLPHHGSLSALNRLVLRLLEEK